MLRDLAGRLIALRAPAPLDPKADPPSRLVMLKWGDNATTKGNFRVGEHSLQSLTGNQHALGFDEVVLDFEHNTVPGHPSNKGEPAAIAARNCVPKVIRGEGLVFESLNWTEAGKNHREHYPDLSPTVATDESGEVIFCHSGAICRNGATFDLHAFSAGIDFKTLNITVFDPPKKPVATDPSVVVPKNAVDLDRLRKLLSLSADATIEDINLALVALEAMPDKSVTGLTADVLAQIKTLAARFDNSERAGIMEEALRHGRIVPKEWLPDEQGNGGLPIPQLRTLCATLPEIVPLEARTPEKLREFTALTPVNPVEKAVCAGLGISEASWKKYA